MPGRRPSNAITKFERCWKERASLVGVSLQVHLKAVSYIDAAGKQLLTAMHGRGVEIRGCGCMTKAVVEEITRQASAN